MTTQKVNSHLSQFFDRLTIDGELPNNTELPNMLQIHLRSYNSLLYGTKEDYSDSKLYEIFQSIFPIKNHKHTAELQFISYELNKTQAGIEECINGGSTYSVSIKINTKLIIYESPSKENKKHRKIKNSIDQYVYIGDMPMMTKRGTFIVNGCRYVIVSQLHRSPGVFFDCEINKKYTVSKKIYSARIIPYRGSWIGFEFDNKELLYFRIDKKRKMHITTFLRALGISKQKLFDFFYSKIKVVFKNDKWYALFSPENFMGYKLPFDIKDNLGNILIGIDSKINKLLIHKIKIKHPELKNEFEIDIKTFNENTNAAENILDSDNNIVVQSGCNITEAGIKVLEQKNIKEFFVIVNNNSSAGSYILNTLSSDKNQTEDDALVAIYKNIRPGEPANPLVGKSLIDSLFFQNSKYDLSKVGRAKINSRLNININKELTVLSIDDILYTIKTLITSKDNNVPADDIDHLSNRRIKSVGELIENQIKSGIVKLSKAASEKLSTSDLETIMPHDLINSKLLNVAIKDFFNASQLSQFMDQTNPLSELTHKRRISALGPGGLNRERAGHEVRDVHQTHYGKICPVETPEGYNIGLINNIALYAKVNEHGFIETPYHKITKGEIDTKITYLSAEEEKKYNIAPANTKSKIKKTQNNTVVYEISEEINYCRQNNEFYMINKNEIDFIDISPRQIVSVATSLIPFLENNDANRALMGSNMQRQAIPLIKPTAPFVGTSMEKTVAKDSGSIATATRGGIVQWVDSKMIIIQPNKEESQIIDIYDLKKFHRSNYNTHIHQIPLVSKNSVVKAGDVIADGAATDNGELALGQNLLVAFMPWRGYNFEDSIIISERVTQKGLFTSIHIEELECVARDTKLGPEEITRDLPNITEEKISKLDESGIIHTGINVKPGDILVGKITPRSESPMTPEEKLLRTIFGEKAADIKDSSLYVPAGIFGTVIDVMVFTLDKTDKDQNLLLLKKNKINVLSQQKETKIKIIIKQVIKQARDLLENNIVISNNQDYTNKTLKEIEKKYKPSVNSYLSLRTNNEAINKKLEKLEQNYNELISIIEQNLEHTTKNLMHSDNLSNSVLKIIKVFIAIKHKLQTGDKMSGRHGNKGVISKILPQEDMPHLEDGTPIDLILNPLGVPSRMNIGQILEVALGSLCSKTGALIKKSLKEITETNDEEECNNNIAKLKNILKIIYANNYVKDQTIDDLTKEELINIATKLSNGIKLAAPVFESPSEEKMEQFINKLPINNPSAVELIDGLTGEKFDRPITVGYIYMMKLHHLVDNKIHARSIGPYSLITQQPLGGKSHFGGQRLGEMECWALQAYGAAYTLQEMLTVKSDDMVGRTTMYESIVRNECISEPQIPESFNVMSKELTALGLNIELQNSKTENEGFSKNNIKEQQQ